MASNDLTLWQSLDAELNNIVDHFSNLIKAAQIPAEDSEHTTGRESKAPGDLLEIWAEKLVYSGYTILHLTSQLKKGALLSDFNSLIETVRSVRGAFEKEEGMVTSKLATMKHELQSMLTELETSYYSSKHRGKLVSVSTSEQLKELSHYAAEIRN